MGSLVDYDEHYVKGLGQCGDPFDEFVTFFDTYAGRRARVLDLGCGQGRDALMAARRGHRVLGVDASAIGMAQVLELADQEGLDVEGVVADIVEFRSRRTFDVVILDRVLHCLPSDEERRLVLGKSCRWTRARGHVLIADTPKHRGFIRSFFEDAGWDVGHCRGNFLFVQRPG